MAKLELSPICASLQGSTASASMRQTKAGTILTQKPQPAYNLTPLRQSWHDTLANFRWLLQNVFPHYNSRHTDSPSFYELGAWGWYMKNALQPYLNSDIYPLFPLDAHLEPPAWGKVERISDFRLKATWSGPHDDADHWIQWFWRGATWTTNPVLTFPGGWLNHSATESDVQRSWPDGPHTYYFWVGYIRKSDLRSSGLLPIVYIDQYWP